MIFSMTYSPNNLFTSRQVSNSKYNIRIIFIKKRKKNLAVERSESAYITG